MLKSVGEINDNET